MRVIMNLSSPRAISATGWRAREIRVEKPQITFEEALKSAPLKQAGQSLFDLVTDKNGFRKDFSVFISGEFFKENVNLNRRMKESEQIHLWDWPFDVRDS